jgi:hypothetical protein
MSYGAGIVHAVRGGIEDVHVRFDIIRKMYNIVVDSI